MSSQRTWYVDPAWVPAAVFRVRPQLTQNVPQISAVKDKIFNEKGWDPKQQKLIYSGTLRLSPLRVRFVDKRIRQDIEG